MSKKPANQPFHAPFAKLKALVKPPCPPPGERATVRERAPPREEPPLTPPRRADAPTDADLWASATAGIERPAPGPARVEPPAPSTAPEPFWHPDLDALKALEALVSGEAPFDLSDSDEFIEGCVPGFDRAILRRLRRGDFAVQGHIDLHGMTRDEAKRAVDEFLKKARTAGKRCVLLVHGRGIHSKDQVPILKEALRTWLATARFGRHVLAFATARPTDGGAGAIYVLLRRAGK
ncbi:MAG TPA: Smr/MutS family protein [Anaeromyxobacteraceae bacterium]